MKRERKYYYRGNIERFRASKRSYVWMRGYSANSSNGLPEAPWMTKRESQKQAKSEDCIAVFVE